MSRLHCSWRAGAWYFHWYDSYVEVVFRIFLVHPLFDAKWCSVSNLPATFLLNSFISKLAPLTNYITDSVSSFNSASESDIWVVRGASFDKKEFKRNVAGRLLTLRILRYSTFEFYEPLRRIRGLISLSEAAKKTTWIWQFRFLLLLRHFSSATPSSRDGLVSQLCKRQD